MLVQKIFKSLITIGITIIILNQGCAPHKVVTITSEPNEANIFLNGSDKGITPYKEDLVFDRVTEYGVILKHKGYFDGRTTISYEPRDKKEYHITLESLSKVVHINSNPEGATVYINGVESGITELTRKLEFHEQEEYEVVLKMAGYYDKKFLISYEPSEITTYPKDSILEKIISVPSELIEVEPRPTTEGIKLQVVRRPTLAYLEVIERSPNVKSVTRITNNEDVDPNVSIGPPVISPTEDILVYEVFVKEDEYNTYSNLWRKNIGSFGQTRVTYGKWLDAFPTFTPDGNNIVFSADRVGSNTLWKIKTEGSGGLINITNTLSEDYSPSISSADDVIVYTSNPPDAEEPQIWKVCADGSLPTQLREGESPQVSPDGTLILFTRKDKIENRKQIWLMDINGGGETQLTQNVSYDISNPKWSPDGQWIVFASNEGLDSKRRQNYDIWIMTKDGSHKTQITTNGSDDNSPCWDGEGRYVYFRSNRGGPWNIWRFEPVIP